jgi:hypothetical protein
MLQLLLEQTLAINSKFDFENVKVINKRQIRFGIWWWKTFTKSGAYQVKKFSGLTSIHTEFSAWQFQEIRQNISGNKSMKLLCYKYLDKLNNNDLRLEAMAFSDFIQGITAALKMVVYLQPRSHLGNCFQTFKYWCWWKL